MQVTPAGTTETPDSIHGSSSDSGDIANGVPEPTKQPSRSLAPKISDLSSSEADDDGVRVSNSTNETAPKVKIPGFSSSDSDELDPSINEPKKQAPANPKMQSLDVQLSDSDDLDIKISEPKASVVSTAGAKITDLSSSGSDDLGVQMQKTVVPTHAAKISTLSSSDSDIAIHQPKKDLGSKPTGQNPVRSSDSENSDVHELNGGEAGRDLTQSSDPSNVQTVVTEQSNYRTDISSSDSAGQSQSPAESAAAERFDKQSLIRTTPNSSTKTEVIVQNSDTEGDSEGSGGQMKPHNRFMELSLSDDLSDDDMGKQEPRKQVNVQEMVRSFLDSDDDESNVPREQKDSGASDSSDDFDFETHTMKKETAGQLRHQELESTSASIREDEGTNSDHKTSSPLGTRKNIDLQLEIPDRGQNVRLQQKTDEEEDLEVKMDIDFDQFDGSPAPHNISTPIPDHTGDFAGPYEEEEEALSSSEIHMNTESATVDNQRHMRPREQTEVEEESIHLEEEAVQEEEELEVKMNIDFDQFDGEKAPHNISTPIPGSHSNSFGDDEPSSPTVTMDIDFAQFDNTKPLHLMSTPRPGQLQFGEEELLEEEDIQLVGEEEQLGEEEDIQLEEEEEQVLELPKKKASVHDLPAEPMNRQSQKRDENDSTFDRDLDDIGRKFNLNLSDYSDGAEDGDEQPSEIIAKMKQMFPDLNLDSSSEEDDT